MLTAHVKYNEALGTRLDVRIREFEEKAKAARISAARTATQTSRRKVKHRRPVAPDRRGRNFEPIERTVKWRAGTTAAGDTVALNVAELDADSPQWIIQEIGTGQRAIVRAGGKANPTGRPAKGATYVRTVKSQVGRRISPNLIFADGPGGSYTPPGAASGQQLFLATKLKKTAIKGVPRGPRRSNAAIRIGREIPAQHFVRDGGKEGFREYRRSVLAAARSTLGKRL